MALRKVGNPALSLHDVTTQKTATCSFNAKKICHASSCLVDSSFNDA